MEQKKVAIVFWGLTKSLHTTIHSIKRNIFDVLTANGLAYDTFIHTYTINGPYENVWTKEKTDSYPNEDVLSILNPKYMLTDDQDTIVKQIDFESYYTKLGRWTNLSPEMTRYLIRNMILALYSKNRITEFLGCNKSSYDYVLFTRPDLEVLTPLDINIFAKLNEKNICVPADDWHSGCNDRFAICKMDTALYYGTLYTSLLDFSRRHSITSERYLHRMLERAKINIITTKIKLERIRIAK